MFDLANQNPIIGYIFTEGRFLIRIIHKVGNKEIKKDLSAKLP